MEQLAALKQAEGRLAVLGDRVSVLSGRLEDLLFRAQRIAHALKDNAKVADTMFGYDLQTFRSDVRAFSHEAGDLPVKLERIERAAQYDEPSLVYALAVMRLSDRMHKGLVALLDKVVLAHQHMREAEHKVEAWFLVKEVESLVQQAQGLPGIANRLLVAVNIRQGVSAGPAPAAGPAAPVLQRRAAVPLRMVGRLVSGSAVPPAKPQS